MRGTVELIILGHTRFGENRLVLHTLSREYGRRSFLTRVGKGAGMALFLPMNIVEGTVVDNPKSTLWNASGFSSRFPLAGIRNNLYKNTITLFMSEVLLRTVTEGAAGDGIYGWCIRNILLLDSMEGSFANFPVWFLLDLADALGFKASFDDVAPFAEGQLSAVQSLLEADFAQAMLVPLTGESRNALSESLLRYLEFHTEAALNVRSLKVLRELFEGL